MTTPLPLREILAGFALAALTLGLGVYFRLQAGPEGAAALFLGFRLAAVLILLKYTFAMGSLLRSARLLRRTWGESLIAYVGLTLAGWVAGLVALGTVLIAFAVAWFVPNWLALASAAAAGLGLFLVGVYLAGVMGDIYRCALYIYASEGVVPAPFTPAMMDAAWKVRPA